MEYGAVSAQLAAESSPAAQRSKNSRGSGDQEIAQQPLSRSADGLTLMPIPME